MRALVIVNPGSGPASRRDPEARRALALDILGARGVDASAVVTGQPDEAARLASEARQAGVDRVVAWGGDGTINGVARALVGGPTALAIVPGGSGNGLARGLGIPLDPAHALALAAAGRVCRIDAGQVDAAWFFNVAGIGLDAAIARRLATPRARRGFTGYVQATVAELSGHPTRQYALRVDGVDLTVDAVFIALANSRQYGNGATIAPRARVDDGRLDLVVVEAQPLWRMLTRLPALFRGTLAPAPGLQMHSFRDAVVASADGGRLTYHVDGEPGDGGPVLRVRVAGAVLPVVVA